MAQRLLYNVTIRVGHEKHAEWLKWMLEQHIPEVMMTGRFDSWRLHKMQGDEGDDGVTYAIGYVVKSPADMELYQTLEAPKLQQAHDAKFRGYYGAFRTIMDIVAEG